ncbi:MAG: PQQ-binding-like beta-propeller repeat protein [Planctomycetaceae bacterium]|nr:PQQ-binding-like beta-propeller repeat protein [Planctomycetaceae bacterium]MBT4725290.1 PQQ-binding-like beta-propeller repeat protein [Planctomycetaceae bacterium]MBT5126410.1 PQQ-binding-like beta-propeller repeat protein [Planctomycetaceae bacterium]MBT5597405.1 PQQ-binding-like beta-propeller repeat protein [Planctomycetaceae bacterium]MBT5884475.1 PQQ-binding-like beta-propeller repeat protein [Planctomycetaceae bacterium]
MRIISTLTLSMLLLFGTPLYGQLRTNGLITHNAARSLGLERAWYLQVPMNPYSNSILDVYLHVNDAEADWSYEVTQDDDSYVFSDKDLDSFGRPLGREQAKINANAFRLKLGGGADLIEHSVPKIYLSMLSNRGDVTLVNGETGQVYWTTHVGNPRHPAVGVCTNDEYTVVVTGVRMFVLRNADGGVVQERMTQSLPGAGPVMVNKYVFVPSIQDRVEYYHLDRFNWTPDVLASSGRVVTQPAIGDQSIAWSTDRGNVYVAGTGRPKLWYRVDTIGKVIAPVAYQQPGQYVANCLDGFVYCINERDGSSIWRQSLGESLVREPVIVRDRVYVISRNKTCFCLSMKTGDVQWSHPDITQIVSASGERLYALDRLGNLIVLNLKNGGHYTSLAAGKIDFVMVNAFTDRIYMGTRSGLIQCIHETHREFPMLHVDEVVTDDVDDNDNNANPMNPANPMPPVAPPVANPFGGGAKPPAANPFGGGAKPPAANPFGGGGGAKPPAANNNPFK